MKTPLVLPRAAHVDVAHVVARRRTELLRRYADVLSRSSSSDASSPPALAATAVLSTITVADDAVFPDTISYGSSGGAGYRTVIQEWDNGGELRISQWQNPLIRYDVANRIKTSTKAAALLHFYRARGGPEVGFRFRDWMDWSTGDNHRTLPNTSNYRHRHVLGAGDGAGKAFQLVKWYRDQGVQRCRVITRPIKPGQTDKFMAVWVNGTLQTEGTHYSVNYATGIVSFVNAPAYAAVVEAAFTFHVPMMFDPSVSEAFLQELVDTKAQSVGSVPLKEIPDLIPFAEPKYRGGAGTITFSVSTQLSFGDGLLQILKPQAGGLTVWLPSMSDVPPGGPVMWLINDGPNAVAVKAYVGSTVITSMASGTDAEIYLGSSVYAR